MERLQLLILAGNHSGAELLSRLIIVQGVVRGIAAGTNPQIIKEMLTMMLGEKYLKLAEKAYFEEKEKMRPVHEYVRTTKQRIFLHKFRDRYYYLREGHGTTLNVVKRVFNSPCCVDDFSITETLDFLFWIVKYNRCQQSLRNILDKVKYADLVTIFKKGNCDEDTYKTILFDGLSNSNQIKLIADVETTHEPEDNKVNEAMKRILEVIKRLDEDGAIDFE
jgi:hypothetical protein